MHNESIETLHKAKSGKISDKWSSYLIHYDTLFEPLRNAPIRMLEIGIQNGGSLETWSRYFKKALLFIGCDIDEKCAELSYDDSRINIVIGDANAATAYEQIKTITPQLDIVIDDGSHKSSDVINSFINYFPLLSPGGIYVVEDAHCLYLNEFGGGLLNDFGAYAFFKRLIDVLSCQFWSDQAGISTYMRTFFDLRATPPFILEGWVDSIEFKNSLITIKKARSAGHNKLGERITVGNEARVQDWGGKLPGSIV